jgi:hypothetical protein
MAVPLAAIVPGQEPVPKPPRPPLAPPAPAEPSLRAPVAVEKPDASVPVAPPALGAPPSIAAPAVHPPAPVLSVPSRPRWPLAWEMPFAPPPATSLAHPVQGLTCAEARTDWRSVNHNSNDDVSTIRMSRPGCDLAVRLEGEIEFDGDAIGIARMSRNARLRIEEDDGNRERWLEIVPGTGGAPSFEYRENGRDAAFDNAAREWYRAVLLQIFRRTGLAAEQRVAALLRRGGVAAVLEEVDNLDSDFVHTRYITELLEQAQLNEPQYRTVVANAARRVESDHYLAEILKTLAAEQPLTARLLDDYIAASRELESDHYRTVVLQRVIDAGGLNTAQVAGVIESAGQMESDHYVAELLKAVAQRYAVEPAFRGAYLRAAQSLESDHYRAEVLTQLLQRTDLSAPELAEVLRATRGVDSDHYQAELLKLAGSRGLSDAAMRQAFFEAAADLESDHFFREAMSVLVEDARLSPALLVNVIDAAARELESDHYLTELLVRVLDRHTITAEVRTALTNAMDSLGSEHYRGRVADRLLRAERR